ncbi:MAG TPA: hypothetical protein VF875_06010 [Anaeromyxobacter sp.]
MTDEPALRASLLQLYLRELPYAVPADDLAAVRAALGPAAITRIEHTPSFRWLPIALEVTILRTVQERRGDEGVRALGRAMGHAALRHAFLRILAEATILMRGRKPETLLELCVKGFGRATQHAGHPRLVMRGSREAVIRLENPPEPMRHRALYVRLGGSAEAALEELGRVTARSSVECDPGWARVDHVVWWTPRGESAARRG